MKVATGVFLSSIADRKRQLVNRMFPKTDGRLCLRMGSTTQSFESNEFASTPCRFEVAHPTYPCITCHLPIVLSWLTQPQRCGFLLCGVKSMKAQSAMKSSPHLLSVLFALAGIGTFIMHAARTGPADTRLEFCKGRALSDGVSRDVFLLIAWRSWRRDRAIRWRPLCRHHRSSSVVRSS